MTTTVDLYAELMPLLDRPKKPDRDGRVWSYCPVHPDGTKHNNPSLSLHPRIGLNCFAGCAFTSIVAALRLRGPLPSSRMNTNRQVKKELVATYVFSDWEDNPVAEKRRYQYADGSKTFEIFLPGEKYPGLHGKSNSDVPLYNLPSILKSPNETVYIVEGEKMADACIEHGLLATTLIQGAGATSFGDALNPLQDRDIILWPDNDPPGVAHMRRLEVALKGIVASVSYVSLPFSLPPKGDAVDYFAMGGTVDALSGTVEKSRIEITGEDSVKITIPYGINIITMEFNDIVVSRRSFDVRLTVSITGGYESYEDDINIQSKSQRTELRRELDSLYGKEWPWVRLLNTACNAVRDAYRTIDRSIDVADIPDNGGEQFLFAPLLPLNSPTIWFGDGSSTKSYVAEIMALSFGIGQPFMGRDTPCLPVIYVDWESNKETFKFRMERIAKGLGLDSVPPSAVLYWDGRGLPLAAHVEGLKRLIDSPNACMVIIDSIMPASDGEPEKAETALRFFNTLSTLKVTTLLIAHITKPPGDGRDNSYKQKPFGSTAWHNMARRTWYIERTQETEDTVASVGFYNKKVNDGPRPRDFALSLNFTDPQGPVHVEMGDIANLPELDENRNANDRIADFLKVNGLSTVAQIADGTGIKPTIISARMGADKKKPPDRRWYYADGEGRYGLLS